MNFEFSLHFATQASFWEGLATWFVVGRAVAIPRFIRSKVNDNKRYGTSYTFTVADLFFTKFWESIFWPLFLFFDLIEWAGISLEWLLNVKLFEFGKNSKNNKYTD